MLAKPWSEVSYGWSRYGNIIYTGSIKGTSHSVTKKSGKQVPEIRVREETIILGGQGTCREERSCMITSLKKVSLGIAGGGS